MSVTCSLKHSALDINSSVTNLSSGSFSYLAFDGLQKKKCFVFNHVRNLLCLTTDNVDRYLGVICFDYNMFDYDLRYFARIKYIDPGTN